MNLSTGSSAKILAQHARFTGGNRLAVSMTFSTSEQEAADILDTTLLLSSKLGFRLKLLEWRARPAEKRGFKILILLYCHLRSFTE